MIGSRSARVRIPPRREPEHLAVEFLPPPEHEQLRRISLDEHRLALRPRPSRDDACQPVGAGEALVLNESRSLLALEGALCGRSRLRDQAQKKPTRFGLPRTHAAVARRRRLDYTHCDQPIIKTNQSGSGWRVLLHLGLRLGRHPKNTRHRCPFGGRVFAEFGPVRSGERAPLRSV